MLKKTLFYLTPYFIVQLFSLAMHSYFTALPYYINHSNGSSSSVGISFSLYLITCIKSKREARLNLKIKFLLVSSVIVLFLISTGFNLIKQSIGILFLTSALLGILQAKCWPKIMVTISYGIDKNNLSKRMVLFNLSWAIPMLLSPILIGYIIDYNLNWSLIFIALLILISSLLFSVMPIKSDTCNDYNTNNKSSDNKVSCRKYSSSILLVASLVVMLYKSHIAEVIETTMGGSAGDFGLIITVVNLGSVICFLLFSRWNGWQWNKKWIVIVNIGAVVSVLTVFIFNFNLLLIGGFLSGFVHGFIFSSHQFYCSYTESSRIEAMTKHEIIQSFCIICGSLLAGVTGEFGIITPYITVAILSLIIPIISKKFI